MERLQSLLGILFVLGVAWSLSTARRRIPWRVLAAGLGLQLALALLLTRVPLTVAVFDALARLVNTVLAAADAGIRFVFGGLGDPTQAWGFVFAVRVTGIIVFFASLMAVLYHIGVMPRVVGGMAWLLRRSLGITGAEALSAAANVFVGQTEAPLCVRPYIAGMTRSQLMTLMAGGFATIAGSVLAGILDLLAGGDEATRLVFTKHLLAASVLSAPASIVCAKLLFPETEPADAAGVRMASPVESRTLLDAAALGAAEGGKLALNVLFMLVAFLSLLELVNIPLRLLGAEIGLPALSLEYLLGLLFWPVGWLLGAPVNEAGALGSLIGQKVILTEFVAYGGLADLVRQEALSPRAQAIAAYALCGFANVGSVAIQIGGLSSLAPGRRVDIVRLAPRALLAGLLASWMTAAVAGLVLPDQPAPTPERPDATLAPR